jgi:hypothetical protein
MSEVTPEQRAEWRADVSSTVVVVPREVANERILALLDALKASERERDGYRERAHAYAKATDDYHSRAERAEAALAEALATPATVRAALNGDEG